MADRCEADHTPQVSVLIVAYQSKALIERCISALDQDARTTAIEILLLDNGDGETALYVAERFPQVRIVPGQGNIGFARGNNVLACEARGEFLLLLNPDMFARAGAIDALFAATQKYPDAAAWGGVTLDANGTPDVGNAIAIPSLPEFVSAALGKSLAGRAISQDIDDDAQVEVLSGGFVMISRSAWARADGFDNRFFLYCEEVDLFHRLRVAGFPLWRIAEARAEHALAHGNNLSPRRLLYRTAGIMTFIRKHWSRPRWILGACLLWLAAMERYLAGRLLGRWKPHLAALGEAYRHVALRPRLWFNGYERENGLMERLARGELDSGA